MKTWTCIKYNNSVIKHLYILWQIYAKWFVWFPFCWLFNKLFSYNIYFAAFLTRDFRLISYWPFSTQYFWMISFWSYSTKYFSWFFFAGFLTKFLSDFFFTGFSTPYLWTILFQLHLINHINCETFESIKFVCILEVWFISLVK